jgi:hypothetical protein
MMRYVPCSKCVLHDVEEEEQVCHHCDKLAMAFGLINTAPGTPLQIRKNLWVVKIATLPQSSSQK